jgi:malate dehydrogenase
MKFKVSVLGAGNVGATIAFILSQAGLYDVALVDVQGEMATGKALDLRQSGAITLSNATVEGGDEFQITADSDIIVQTAGLPRLPGMTRDDLLQKNAGVTASVIRRAMEYNSNPIVIVVSNPLDAMCHVALSVSGLSRERVLGMAGVLDSARFRTFIAMELGVSVCNLDGLVLGGHGDTMVPLPRLSTVAGVPIDQFLSLGRIDAIVERTRNGGTEIVSHLKSGGAYYAPAAAAVEMIRAVCLDEHESAESVRVLRDKALPLKPAVEVA